MPLPILTEQFQLPLSLDVTATCFGALTGASAGSRRGYDISGVLTVALVAGAGGGLLRDIILGGGPPVLLKDGRLLLAVLLGALVGICFVKTMRRYERIYSMVDTFGLAIYAVVGALKGIHAGLSPLGVVVLGTINAVGGGLLRDVIVREESQLLKPGQLYMIVALFNSGLFMALVLRGHLASLPAALIVIPLGFLLRMLAIRYDWQTRPVQRNDHSEPE
jgi:uncharacterized membrane protein YeiH